MNRSPRKFLRAGEKVQKKRLSIPRALHFVLAQSNKIARFSHPDFPTGIFFDTVMTHSIRAAYVAETLPLDEVRQKRIFRSVLLHDIPEALTSLDKDVTIIEKQENPALSEQIDHLELDCARRVFRREDLALYESFILAEKIIYHGTAMHVLYEDSVIAKVLDVIDGNMCFHYFVSKWIAENPTLEHNDIVFHKGAFEYAFTLYKNARQHIEKADISLEGKRICKQLLSDHLSYIIACWQIFPPERIPPLMVQMLKTRVDVIS